MPAAVTRQQTSPNLFRATLPTAHLKAMATSAKAISDLLVLELDDSSEEHAIRFWADDGDTKGARPTCALVGTINNSAFQACEGDGLIRTIQVPTKHIAECVGAFDSERPIELRLTSLDNRFILTLKQSKDDESDPDTRTITVQPSDTKPVVPIVPKGAYAGVDLKRLNKVLGGLKKNTDVVTVTIEADTIEIAASTKKVQDSWRHNTTTAGEAKGLFAVGFLKKAVAAAVAVDPIGEIHLSSGHPIKVSAATEDIEMRCWAADRAIMRTGDSK